VTSSLSNKIAKKIFDAGINPGLWLSLQFFILVSNFLIVNCSCLQPENTKKTQWELIPKVLWEATKIWRNLPLEVHILWEGHKNMTKYIKFMKITLRFLLYVLVLLYVLFYVISGGSYCSFSLLHYSSYYTYCSKKLWILLLIFITVLLFLLYVLFSKTRPVTFISTGLIIGT
jgi:hypothetical protein